MSDLNAIRIAKSWIRTNIEPCNNQGAFSSYGLKHCFEYDTKQYITNDDFKRAMVESGYLPTKQSKNLENWLFRYRAKAGKTLTPMG